MTRQIKVGDVLIGGSAPIAIQSMSTFSPADTEYAAAQINALDEAGADIVRLAVPDKKASSSAIRWYAELLFDFTSRISISIIVWL